VHRFCDRTLRHQTIGDLAFSWFVDASHLSRAFKRGSAARPAT
jgi:hypothetical protein